MMSLISVVCSVSHDLLSVSSFFTLSALSHGPGTSQWGGPKLPQGRNAGPHSGGSCGVQNKLESFLFCNEYHPDCLCTLSNSKRRSLNQKLSDGALGNAVEFLLLELQLFRVLSGYEWFHFTHTCVCIHVNAQHALTTNKNCHTRGISLPLRG